MHKPTLVLFSLTVTALGSAPALAENSISYQALKYQESNDRIDVIGSAVTVEKDFGTDYHTKIGLDYDAVSGATPLWQPKAGYINEFEQTHHELADEARNGVSASVLKRDANRNEYTVGAGWSEEPDFIARQVSAQAMIYQDDSHNRSFTIGSGVLMNTAVATEFTNHARDENSTLASVQGGITQILDRTSTAEVSLYYGRDTGFLSNQYLKIVRTDPETLLNFLADDDRPNTRESGGIALRHIKAYGRDWTSQLFYRYYSDSWGIDAHTVETKLFYDVQPEWRINPVFRLHQQSEADFYRAYDADINTFADSGVGSNDARLGNFDAVTAQLNVEYRPSPEWSLNSGVSDYRQYADDSESSDFQAHWFTAGFTLRY